MECVDLYLYACIMLSFLHKKSPVFSPYDILCRDIILSLHFLFSQYLWINCCVDVGVSLQNHMPFHRLKKNIFRLRWSGYL